MTSFLGRHQCWETAQVVRAQKGLETDSVERSPSTMTQTHVARYQKLKRTLMTYIAEHVQNQQKIPDVLRKLQIIYSAHKKLSKLFQRRKYVQNSNEFLYLALKKSQMFRK